ncbi:MAG: DNA repair protein RadA, partial [Oscillospiraceae bacterium]|nr:DNA repair protein RadA [Oscillospiraceae bacterium]
MAKPKKVFYCTDCGNELHSWQGQCPACHEWNTIVEAPAEKPSPAGKSLPVSGAARFTAAAPKPLNELAAGGERRVETGFYELDRVLGGGAVLGSLILVGGAPGIG